MLWFIYCGHRGAKKSGALACAALRLWRAARPRQGRRPPPRPWWRGQGRLLALSLALLAVTKTLGCVWVDCDAG